jgi:hypothetical protein
MVDTVRFVSDGEELVLSQAEPSRVSAEVDGRATSLHRRSHAGMPSSNETDARRGERSRWLRRAKR